MTEEEKFQAFIEQYVADARANGCAHFNTEHLEDAGETSEWGPCIAAPLAHS